LVRGRIPSLVRLPIVRDRDHAKFGRNKEPPERFTLTLDHVAGLEIAQRYRASEIVDLCSGIDRDQRESLD
jgi:hypothetical protein